MNFGEEYKKEEEEEIKQDIINNLLTTYKEIEKSKPKNKEEEEEIIFSQYLQNMIKIGNKCKIFNENAIIRYYGKLENDNSNKEWIGVEWENEGVGKNDGVAFEKRYFTTKPKGASFIEQQVFLEKFKMIINEKEEKLFKNYEEIKSKIMNG
jgi:hypothetical protein